MLPTREALDKVETLQASNIFPPQVTLAAYRLREQGKLAHDLVLPSTITAGKEAFKQLAFVEPKIQERKSQGKEASVSFQNISVSYRTVKGEPKKIYDQMNLDLHK